MQGRVLQVSVKPETPGEGGLPKRSVDAAWARRGGLEGDFNRYRHEAQRDDPDRALLIVPLETIRELNAEGWPVQPGDLAENLTTTGIPFARFAPGKRYVVGESEIQISRPCEPCESLYLLPYVGNARGPEFAKTIEGRRGWYARVLREGLVRRGDPIEERP